MPELYVGLMSGTSLDGVDAVLADLSNTQPRLVGHRHERFAPALRNELLALNHSAGDELRRAALAANNLAREYASLVNMLLAQCAVDPRTVTAVGCHGQTVRHQPADEYTIQLVNGSLLAERTGVTVICDFRGRDIAAGGQGAPLAPAFHNAVFARPEKHRVIVNIGGIANLTDLPPAAAVTGFDCGPGNVLLDAWVQQHLQQPYDCDGAWAQTGKPISGLLARLLDDDYFRRVPPKSTGRDTFGYDWLARRLTGAEQPADVQATLLALTANCIAAAVEKFCAGAQEVYVCGGGARNAALAELLARQLAPRRVAATDVLGIDAEHVEALAFAWLARQALKSRPGNIPSVTGARGPRVLGAIYPA
jgi:anhydro-N-acetylmuramic acid kinase